jgi:DNA-binding beta-propeller fold protein YncE
MRKWVAFFIIQLALFSAIESLGQLPGKISSSNQVLLPNGWKLNPAGTSLPLGDLPLNMQLSHDGKLLAVTNNGQSVQSIQLIDPKNDKLLDEKIVAKSWYGLAFSRNDKVLYVSGGNDNIILAISISGSKFGKTDTFTLGKAWPENKIGPTGLAIDDKAGLLYVVTKEDSALYVISIASRNIVRRVPLGSEAYSCMLAPDGKTLYISLWGSRSVALYKTSSGRIENSMQVGDHPNEMLLNKAGSRLFVANSGDNSISIIQLPTGKVIERLSATLFPTELTGSTTDGLALSPDERTLYVANADNNCLVVFDVVQSGKSFSKGFIPVGWYPTNVKTLGKKIFVANGKGLTSLANPLGPQPFSKSDNSGYQKGIVDKSKVQYIGGLFKGTLSIIPVPTAAELKKYSAQVYANTPFHGEDAKSNWEDNNPIPNKAGKASPFKFVFYIIKENRTYDQVLGDLPNGNGDTSLCLFPRRATPNQHALAEQFVLLDNFYVDAEVSADGHNWSTAAYANDFVEKTWPTSYGRRGGNYDYEGSREIAYPLKGFIWDYCARKGISYRTYGEFAEDGKTYLKSLEGHICNPSPGFDMDITDQFREQVWERDFDSLLTIGSVPQLSTIRLSSDHTSGQQKGKITPTAAVADNDLAVGKLVEHLSRSSIWKESVVFILEDDAQNGPDHVDAHRSTVYLAGAYVKRHAVLHQMYSTSSLLHTIELILGLPHMSQYDAAATPMWSCFQPNPDTSGFSALPANVDLNARNVAVNESSIKSNSFDLAKEDAVPDLLLNEVVWKFVKGEHSTMPAPVRSAFVFPVKDDDDDDD